MSEIRSTRIRMDIGNYLEFLNRKATTQSQLHVVFDSRATHSGSQLVQRTGRQLGCLLDTGNTSRLLSARLIEPGLHAGLPVLVEMSVWQQVVVLHSGSR